MDLQLYFKAQYLPSSVKQQREIIENMSQVNTLMINVDNTNSDRANYLLFSRRVASFSPWLYTPSPLRRCTLALCRRCPSQSQWCNMQ